MIGSPNYDVGLADAQGMAFVAFGAAVLTAGELSNLPSTGAGFEIASATAAGDQLGRAVAGAGDIDGDGLDDVLIGAPGARAGVGDVSVVYGKQDSAPVSMADVVGGARADFVVQGDLSSGPVGDIISGAGDVNGDGLDDLALGSAITSQVHVVFGKRTTSPVALGALGGSGFDIRGRVGQNAGIGVSGGYDLDGDGLDEVVLASSQGVASGNGVSYVILGKRTRAPFHWHRSRNLPREALPSWTLTTIRVASPAPTM